MELFFEQLPVVLGALNTGFIQTLKLFFVTLLGAFPLGLLIALGSMSKFKPLSYLMKFIVWIVRGTPLMIQLLIIYYFPGLVFHNPVWGGGEGGRFVAASVSFIVNYACYFSEIYRGGIQGIPVGQEEAGLVLGMTPKQIFFKVKLLQMIKKIVPAMSNEIITLVKYISIIHEYDLTCNILCKCHLMGNNYHGCLFVCKVSENLKYLSCELRIKSRCRLIETQDVRLQRKRPCYSNSLALSA